MFTPFTILFYRKFKKYEISVLKWLKNFENSGKKISQRYKTKKNIIDLKRNPLHLILYEIYFMIFLVIRLYVKFFKNLHSF